MSFHGDATARHIVFISPATNAQVPYCFHCGTHCCHEPCSFSSPSSTGPFQLLVIESKLMWRIHLYCKLKIHSDHLLLHMYLCAIAELLLSCSNSGYWSTNFILYYSHLQHLFTFYTIGSTSKVLLNIWRTILHTACSKTLCKKKLEDPM
jgi:hypothetical protein